MLRFIIDKDLFSCCKPKILALEIKIHTYLLLYSNVSFKEFATELLIKQIEEFEDSLLARKARKRLDEMDESENLPFEDVCDLAGWKDEE